MLAGLWSSTDWACLEGLTCDGEVTDELVRVWSVKPFCEVDIGELTSDHWSHVEGFELVEGATELERLLVVDLEI